MLTFKGKMMLCECHQEAAAKNEVGTMQSPQLAFTKSFGSSLPILRCQNRLQALHTAKRQCNRRRPFCCSEVTPKSQAGLAAAHVLSSKYPRPLRKPLPTLAPRHFINLTNGIEALPDMASLLPALELRFTRIQSSHCESGAYDKLLASLDNDLLFSLACGRECYVYDFGSRNKSRGVPRALYMGLEFVKWSLSYLWFTGDAEAIPEQAFVRGKNTVPYWRDQVLPYKISKDTKKKVRYFAPFAKEMGVRDIKLQGVYGRVSEIDGCKDIHVKIVRDWLENDARGEVGTDGNGQVENETLETWIQRHGYAQFKTESTAEELVGIQEWMSSFPPRHDESTP